MKARALIILAVLAVSSCFFINNSDPEIEAFKEKIKILEKELDNLRELFLEQLNKTENEQILEEYGRKGVSALDQKVSARFTKGIAAGKKYNTWISNLGRNLKIDEELKAKIFEKLKEIRNDQTGEFVTEKFLFGGSEANKLEYILLLAKHDPKTDKTSVALARIKTAITISENFLVLEKESGEITERSVVVQPENFTEDDIKLISTLCEYIAIQSFKSFFDKA